MKATMKSAKRATVADIQTQFPRSCNDCRGTGGVYINEDLQVEFDLCMKCNGYGWIYGENA